jgi:hypothetical protein
MEPAATSIWGWYRDPFREHEDRYFSEGKPTKLVRDSGQESFDAPPEAPWSGPPVPVPSTAARSSGGNDMRRADDAEREAPFNPRAACEKATSAMLRYGSAN